MKTTILTLWLMAFSLAAICQSMERHMTGSLGASEAGGSLLMQYSLGEAFTGSLVASNLIITMGFQQPGQVVVAIPEEIPVFQPVLFPNPSAGTVRINLPEQSSGTATIRAYDAWGREILCERHNGRSVLLDLNGQPEGLYFLRITDGRGEWQERMVIAR